MKNLLFIIILISQSILSQSVFDKANNAYKQGNYQQAIDSYQSILKSKKHSSGIYFNMANCYYKLNQVAPAIYNYEKALLLNPKDKDIKTNLEFAKNRRIDDIKIVQTVGFEKLFKDITNMFNYNTWGYVIIILSFVFLLFFIGYYFSETTLAKRIFFVGIFGLPIIIIGAIFSALLEKSNREKFNPAIVFSESSSVKTEPKENAQEAFVLHEGTKVFILEEVDAFSKIILEDETEGWIYKKDIKTIK